MSASRYLMLVSRALSQLTIDVHPRSDYTELAEGVPIAIGGVGRKDLYFKVITCNGKEPCHKKTFYRPNISTCSRPMFRQRAWGSYYTSQKF